MKKRYIFPFAVLMQTSLSPMAYAVDVSALPTGGVVVKGSADISQSSAQMQIIQHSDKAVINWQGFDVGRDAQVRFQQNSAGSVALNRVISGDASQIHGRILANGQIYLLNPSGVVFGNSARVDVGGLVASTHDMRDDDFLNGKRVFTRNGSTGKVENHGTITTRNGGDVALIGTQVENKGIISAQGGNIALAAGEQVTLNAGANGYLQVAVDGATLDTIVTNGGLLQADGGQIIMNAQSAGAAYASVVSNTGTVQAQTMQNKEGRILLLADMAHGTVKVAGMLDASASDTGNGGFIETSAAQVQVADAARITTKAMQGQTGNWLIDPDDYTIAVTGGNMTGAALAANLASTNVILETNAAGSGGNGDIFVNDAVNWNANTTLTLTADRNIEINKNISASGNTAGLVLEYGRAGSGGYVLNDGASITLTGTAASLQIGQSGSLQNYTIIHDVTELQGMSGNLSGYYALGNNINASATSGWNGGLGFEPVGNGVSAFTGQFHGLGHSINTMTINRPAQDYAGLFGNTSGATVRDVGMVGGSVTGKDFVGALVGNADFSTIYNAYASTQVTGTTRVGGLIGRFADGDLSDSYTTANVSGTDDVGGLVGRSDVANLSGLHATGTVTGSGLRIGGLVGRHGGTLTDSYATGAVTGASNAVGGLAGRIDALSTVSNVYATGTVSGTASGMGGLVGVSYSDLLSNAHALGSVNGSSGVGGLVGTIQAGLQIINSYATGAVNGTSNVGGLIGNAVSAIAVDSSYSMGNVTAVANNIGGLVGSAASGMTINNSYATGDVTANGNSIGGLVGNSLATISASHAEGAVNGLLDVGGLVGASGGNVTLSYATGNVSGNFDVGGLIGANVGSVSESFATGNVTGNVDYAGGLAGYNSGTMNNVYASGTVNGVNFVGGLTGYNFTTITNSYFTGVIAGVPTNAGGLVGVNTGTINASFWNQDTAGIADNGAGTALTTAQMRQLASFSGWDISAQGGDPTVWRIYEGNSMPLLRGFFTDTFTVTAKNATAVEGIPYFGGNGTVPATFPAGISGSVSYGGNSQGASAVGTYAITPQGLYSGQFGYDIIFVDGQLTMSIAPPFTPRDSATGVDGGVLSLPLKTQEQVKIATSSEEGDGDSLHEFDNAHTKQGAFGRFLTFTRHFIPI